jgi:ABC-type polysaccharide/polyol phosphate export permease
VEDAPDIATPAAPAAKRHEEGSIGEVLSRLVDDAEAFVRAEISLYRAEAIHKVNIYRRLLALAAFGGLLAFGSVTLLLIALVFALSPYLGAAWAAFLVALVAMAIAALSIGLVVRYIRRDLREADEIE